MAGFLSSMALLSLATAIGLVVSSRLNGWSQGGFWSTSRALGTLRGTRFGGRWATLLESGCVQAGHPEVFAQRLLLLQIALVLVGSLLAATVWGAGGLGLGWILGTLPWLWLRGAVRKRHSEIRKGLPMALELMGMTIESGLDFGTAWSRGVERLRAGPLKEELESTLRELKLGKTRAEALAGLRDRVALPEIGALVLAVVQSERMGTPLGPVLRAQVSQLQTARTQRAETLAAEAPVKMLLPLVVCIFPTVFLVLLGPIAFSIVHGTAGG